jgi:DNA-binding NtrC family response regulator
MNLQPCTYTNGHLSRRTILLVEDEPFVREATRGILESAGFEVLPAEDAGSAVRAYEAREHAVDLVMTDMVLPGRTGEQLGQDLRQRSPELRVLVTSGYGNAEFETEDPGSQTYFLAKPYSRRMLVEKIERILNGMPLHHAAPQAG